MKIRPTIFLFCIAILAAGIGLVQSYTPEGNTDSSVDLPEVVDFNFHIKPILSDRCYHCHGPDENSRKAGLRLDTQQGAMGRGESGSYAIVSGKPSKSELIRRLTSHDPEVQMPPPESGLRVSEYEVTLLEKWIDQGAKWKKHWAFIPPQKTQLPKISQKGWPHNEIDHYILSKLEQNGLSPSESASKQALIRRLSFDLTGLPPTLAEIDAFVADDSDNAYEKVVDRLLASPRYGERMAIDWLGVARYGDTHGYEADSRRMAWQWRDWVIEAFNSNLPYNQFITQQLAGDLMPNPSREQLIATAFNRNHLMNSENGILDEEWRVEYVSDRTNTAGKAILGLTMECAKCHDHKFDPISQKEYFGMFAFFNNVDEPGQIRYESQAYPVLNLTTTQQQRTLNSLNKISSQQREEIAVYINKVEKEGSWESRLVKEVDLKKGLEVYVPFEEVTTNKKGKFLENKAALNRKVSLEGDAIFTKGIQGKAFEFDGINQILFKDAGNSFGSNESFSYSFWARFPEPFQEARFMGTEDGNFDLVPGYLFFIEHDKLSFQLCNTWDHNYIKVTSIKSFPFEKWTHLTVTYDGSSKASGVEMYMDGEPLELEIKKDNLSKQLPTQAWFTIGHSSFQGGALDEFRQYSRVLTLPEVSILAGKDLPEEGWLDFYLYNVDKKLDSLRDGLKNILSQKMSLLDTIPQLMVMKDLQDSIRPTYILDRGIYSERTERVEAHTPTSILAFEGTLPKDRLGFAEWLFAPEHPLTARVMVNRMWQMVFGQGLVATPDDFGNQGSLPTHPELLDALAVDFQESGWDMKGLFKKLVMSATYRQSASISPHLYERDPTNELLARAPRYRLPAEMIRDNALMISGLLVEKIGGEPVKPYQPAGIWAQVSTAQTPYDQDHGNRLYRRSLYTYWKRAVPPPNMVTFDAPTRHACTVKREATSTPLQALILLNDVQFVEASRVFAEHLLQNQEISLEERITNGFRMATARRPSEEELASLSSLYEESKREFQQHNNDVQALLQTGEYPVDENLDPLEVAAYTMVTSAILNMNETITKG
ncbi:MAG: DUF1553 domain-containing protein [Bacteroidota bacterium]